MLKKLHFITPSLSIGGAERVMVWIANALSSEYKITFIVLNRTENSYSNELDNKICVKYFNIKSVKNSFFILYKYILQNKNDYFFSAQMHSNVLLLILKILFFKKLKLGIREANSLNLKNLPGKKDKFLYFLSKYIYRSANFIVALDHQTKSLLINKFNIEEHLVNVIGNPIDVKLIDYMSIEPIEEDYSDYFIAVGRLEPQKNLKFLIELFRSNNHKLLIVGEGSQFDELSRLIIKYNISSRVRLLGYKKNVFKYIYKAKALLLPSLYEGFPNVVVQSLYLGVPVFANEKLNVAGDLIKFSKLGYTLNIQNRKDWHDAILNFNSNTFSSSEAKEFCLNNYGSYGIAKKYSKLFNEIT